LSGKLPEQTCSEAR